jgi:ABC-type glycerol-3-phosphate transport system substrate-binding protein
VAGTRCDVAGCSDRTGGLSGVTLPTVSRRAWFRGTGAGAASIALGALAACRPHRGPGQTLRVWAHHGQEAENLAMRAIAAAFNAEVALHGAAVELSFFSDFHYTEKLSIAAAAGDMPDSFELDGPLIARFVDAGLLAPLDPFFSPEERSDFLPTILAQGSIEGRLYALGAFDSAAVLYYDRQQFERARVVPPDADLGFAWPELLEACGKLVASGSGAIALHMNESADEWFTYAFSPVLWSGGGRLISRDGVRIRGVLASPANVASLSSWQELFRRGFAARDPVDPDPFGSGSVAMDWSGHWMARSHLARKGPALGVLSLPRIGPRSVAPCGSYCWGISATTELSALAVRWLRWITDARRGIQPLVTANGAVPARRSAFAAFPEYQHLPYSLFRRQLEQRARPRPRTPFYATLTQHWASALRDIAHGSNVSERLAQAEDEVLKVIRRRLGTRGEVAG